jgi:hypothetical protein
MNGWRDFALRGSFRVPRRDGADGPERICESRFSVSLELKGEG